MVFIDITNCGAIMLSAKSNSPFGDCFLSLHSKHKIFLVHDVEGREQPWCPGQRKNLGLSGIHQKEGFRTCIALKILPRTSGE